jgi:thiosulfate/3-mercaptopyruvate sulfurtransferase
MDGNRFMAPEQIRARLAQIGLSPGDPVITFCNGGYFCSAMWFAAHEVAGFSDVQVFDGSMAAWTRGSTRDVVAGDGPSLAKPVVN